jgi:NhaP-type Na+/H+ or K+/H+ antiporter
VHKNLTLEVRKLSAFIFNLLAHTSETTCFVLLGLCVFLTDFPTGQWPYMLSVLGLCLLSRPLAVYPLLTMVSVYAVGDKGFSLLICRFAYCLCQSSLL